LGICGCSQRDVCIICNADAKRIVRGFAVTIKLSHAIGGTAPGRLQIGGQPAKVREGIKPSIMAIAPTGLERVTADYLPASQFKARGAVSDIRPRKISENVRLAAAGRTRAGAPETLDFDKRFDAVIPLQRQLAPNQLHVFRLQTHPGKTLDLSGCASISARGELFF
jgi:hypothetical protein